MSTISEPTDPSNSSTAETNANNAQQSLSKDTIFHLLQVQRRRLALHYLQGTTGSVEMRDLAEQVAAWEYNTTVDQLVSKKRQRTYISLYQSHLPELDKEGIIEYDQERGRVTRTELATQLDPYLTTIQNQQARKVDEETSDIRIAKIHRWTHVYFGGILFSCGLLLAKTVNFVPVARLSGQLILFLLVLLFSIITVGYQVTQKS